MNSPLAVSLCLALWALPCWAAADTLYQCVTDGKRTFSSLPCPVGARQTGTLSVPAPESAAESAARLERERDQLRVAELQFQTRQHERDRVYRQEQRQFAAQKRRVAAQIAHEQRNKERTERREARLHRGARLIN